LTHRFEAVTAMQLD